MSLIDEALKRARQEAAVQDAAQREAQFRRVPVYAPPPRRSNRASSGNGLLMAGAGTLAGAVLVLALAFFAGWLPAGKGEGKGNGDGEPRPAAAPEPVEVQAAASPTPVPRVLEGTEAPRLTPAQPAAPVEPRPAPPRETPAPVPQARPVAATPAPTPAPSPVIAPPEPAAAAPAAPSPATQTAPAPPDEAVPGIPAAEPVSRSYVREVPVPEGGSLVLSGIAFSAERPVALLNGRPVVPGESIEGFTVVAIEPGGVRLDGHGQKVFVTLH